MGAQSIFSLAVKIGRGISNSRSSPASESMLSVRGLALGHVTEAVAEGVESVEGDEVLIFEDGVDAAGQLLMHALAVGSVLRGTGEQLDDLAWRIGCACRLRRRGALTKEARVESKS